MIEAETIIAREARPGPLADTITLDDSQRMRRRMAMVSDGGIAFLLNLAPGVMLREGDAIVLGDGRLVEVRAKPEEVYAVQGRDAAHLLALAWHLGNRHVPTAISEGRLLIRRDHAVAEMVRALGGTLEAVDAVFEPDVHADTAGDVRS
ncbi:urease accessory protein [Aureimonas altamirensis DSM 21988]|uniref:Urease accessory protein UreE n=1 Tax=Aureimonas altamirensis DSM 21988 TaxID=1121026 RepID=A0ABY1IFZ3_9HYPH|nr:urease accessory protein UreE [Aureimonas altamirensis]SHJ12321.1 urease accessory protein [Aureimonas altamirensis DSM 21988]